ncbi:4551_t:CDS:1, partial [Scutellospora calospora]
NKHKKEEKVQSSIPSEEQTQESPKYKTQRRTNTRKEKKSKALFLVKNKYKKV